MVVYKYAGFTLIEVMIVVTVIGILSAIAYPSYQEYSKKTQREIIKQEMRDVAKRLQEQKVVYKRYDKIPFDKVFSTTVNTANGKSKFPASKPTHQLFFTNKSMNDEKNALKSNVWILRAVPINPGLFKGDGDLKLNNDGGTCWVKSDSKCTINSSNEWKK